MITNASLLVLFVFASYSLSQFLYFSLSVVQINVSAHEHTHIFSQRSVVADRLDKMLQLPQATASCVLLWDLNLIKGVCGNFFPH